MMKKVQKAKNVVVIIVRTSDVHVGVCADGSGGVVSDTSPCSLVLHVYTRDQQGSIGKHLEEEEYYES